MRVYIFLIALLFNQLLYANENKIITVNAAVAEEFKNGLHSKYLQYFANKLNVKLNLTTLPFARRLKQIEDGQLDLIVGIQETDNRRNAIVYITPYYESLSYRFFTLAGNQHTINSYHDLAGKIIGVNRYAKYFEPFNNDDAINKFKAKGVLQNIELLLRHRIDAFVHYEESTLPLLAELGIEDKIVKTIYQPDTAIHHYLAISAHSQLMKRKAELEAIVKQAIKNKDLLAIRLNHYAELENDNRVHR